MKKATLTIGLFSLVMILTSFTTPETTKITSTQTEAVGAAGGKNVKLDAVGAVGGKNVKLDAVGAVGGGNVKLDAVGAAGGKNVKLD